MSISAKLKHEKLQVVFISFFMLTTAYSQSYYDALEDAGLDEQTISTYKQLMDVMGVSESDLQTFADKLNNAKTAKESADAMVYLYRLMQMDEATISMMRDLFLESYVEIDDAINSEYQDGYDYEDYGHFDQKEVQNSNVEENDEEVKNYELCLQEDHFEVPEALKIEHVNNPVNEQAIINYIRQNGDVLFDENGIKFYHLIERAITQSDLKRKFCQVGKESFRNIANNNKKLLWYHLYMLLENTSESAVKLLLTSATPPFLDRIA